MYFCTNVVGTLDAAAGLFGQGSRGWLRLHEKGGKRHDVPAHHRAAAVLDAYVEAGRLQEPKAALFQSVDPAARRLTGRALERRVVLAMVKRRAVEAELPPSTCCHTFRATGITAYLSNGGTTSPIWPTPCGTCRGVGLRVLAGQGAQIDTTRADPQTHRGRAQGRTRPADAIEQLDVPGPTFSRHLLTNHPTKQIPTRVNADARTYPHAFQESLPFGVTFPISPRDQLQCRLDRALRD